MMAGNVRRIDEAYDLVSASRDLMRIDRPGHAGLWPRAAALLGRQALEAAMASLWEFVSPGLEDHSLRTQLLCLPFLIGDRELGTRSAATWSSLSDACHTRVYEVAPTAPELESWLATVWDLTEAVAALQGRMEATRPS